jgi:peptidoglycan hydrolase CwlO-like protein
MTDKQIIIDGFNLEYIKELLYNGQRSAISTNIFEAIIEKLECKEQECEEWQAKLAYKESELQNIEETIKPLMKRPDDLDCYNLEWIVCAFANEFNQLKAENEELKETFEGLLKVQHQLADNCKQLRHCLTEIKVIIHFNKNNRLSGGADISIEQILQKISEVEDDRQF